nr:Imm57 family immunity protein [Pseudomonas gingeri]
MSCCLGSIAALADQSVAANEARQVRFAERVITVELARALSPRVREERAKCARVCPETGALELGIGLIGMARGEVASEALINLLGLRLDGAGSEEVGCQILSRGKALGHQLEKTQPGPVAEHCNKTFNALRKRELFDVSDVGAESVCRTDSEILSARKELLQAINSNVVCESE